MFLQLWMFIILCIREFYHGKFRLLSFGHTLAHNQYVWHGGVEADHVVISGYSLALQKSNMVYKVRSIIKWHYVVGYYNFSKFHGTHGMEKYSGLEAILILQRHPEYYLSRIYIPRLENDYKNVDITCFIQLFVCVHQLDWAVCTSHVCPWKVKNQNQFVN